MTSAAACTPLPKPHLLPGLLLACAIAAAATLFAAGAAAVGLVASPLVVALLLGLVLAQLRPLPAATLPGLGFACRPLLRLAIVLLGLRIGLPQVAGVGLGGLGAVAVLVVLTFAAGYCVSRRLGLSADQAWLLAAGHAICGAAAVAAADSMLKAKDAEVAQTLTLVTLFGTVVMLLTPLVGGGLALEPSTYGFWVGGSVHEVAQAVAAGFARGDACGEAASLVKMVRVAFLLPLGLFLGVVVSRRARGPGRRAVIVPWFVVGFAAVAIVDALGAVPAAVAASLRGLGTTAMTVAMAALGLKSSLRALAVGGLRPVLAAGATTAVVSGLAFALACAVG